jgi:trigger factor
MLFQANDEKVGAGRRRMKVSVERISDIAHRVQVELPEDAVDQHLKKAYRRLNRSAKIKGFRPGKVPIAILKQHYSGQINREVGVELINETLMQAVEQTEMDVVSQSDLDREPLQEGQPFRYSFTVEVKPAIDVRDYKEIPAQKEVLSVTDDEIDAELERRRQENFHFRSLKEDRPVERGDHVVLDFTTLADGRPVPGGEAKNFHLEVGSNRFSPDFENKLLGAGTGEQRDIEVTFPSDYGNEQLAGKTATFQVLIQDIQEKVLPELNDEFAKSLGDFETLEDLRTAVRRELESKKKEQQDSGLWQQIRDELIRRNPFEVPQSMVEQELQRMLDTIEYRLTAQNLSLEQAGIDEKTFKERHRQIAEMTVRTSIILENIAHQEHLAIQEEELEQALEETAANMNQPYDKVKDFYRRSNLLEQYRKQLLEEKVFNFLKDQATITEADAAGAADSQKNRNQSEEGL